jgi:hypothetical protein
MRSVSGDTGIPMRVLRPDGTMLAPKNSDDFVSGSHYDQGRIERLPH